MEVPLVLNNIGMRYGLTGHNRKSSTPSQMTGAEGLSAFIQKNYFLWLLLQLWWH